ncbi:MAG TPA: glycosyltransferase family 4 protein [Clostridiaceae bacterium]|nr:glycosyltransferase family 4 protein [Clostridiaceae bacterium]
MKILMLSWEYPPRIVGGISRVVYDLAQKLGENGNEVHVVTCWEQSTKEFEKDKNVFVYRVHTYNISTNNFVDWVLQLNFALIEQSIRIINKTGKMDIIHAHDWIVAFAARALKHSFFIPLISTIHATESGRNGGIHNEVQRYINDVEWWLTYESWKVVVNSQYMKHEVEKIFKLPGDKVVVIPNGVNLNKFDGIKRDDKFRRNYASDHEKLVMFVGRLVNEKGAHVLIDAIPKILKHYNDVKFVITGKGPQLEYLKGRAMELGVSNKVYFTGYISDENLSKMYKCADMAVFPSLYEPFGIVALEGMVANVPVVVSDTGGLGEIVDHGIDGMKSYSGNSGSLADNILELLFNPCLAEKIKRNAIDKIKNVYNWDIISKKMSNIYKEIINESNKVNWCEN